MRVLQGDKGCKGTAYVCFKGAESVSLALQLNKTEVLKRQINVERFHTKKLGGGTKEKTDPKKKKQPAKGGKPAKGGDESPKKKKNKNFVGAKTDQKKKVKLSKISN